MSVWGQKRRFRRAPATSGRLSTTDISVAAGLPPVQTREGAQTIVNLALLGFCEVHREATLSFEVKARSYFEALVQRMENAIKLAGQLNHNGPGHPAKAVLTPLRRRRACRYAAPDRTTVQP
jgi:hypothetical protein